MYSKDVQQLLDHCKEEIENLSAQAESGQINKVTLKNTLENMRSILDYHAQDILKKLKTRNQNKSLPVKVYFPYGQRENHFKIKVKENLPRLLQEEPVLYSLIESVQPFKSKDNWLVDLCFLTNDAKHNKLTKTEVQKTASIRQGNFIHIEGGSNITLRNNYGNGARLDDVYIGNNGDVTVIEHSGGTEITINNRLKFHGKELLVVPFLKKCYGNLVTLTDEISKAINQNA
jgi:hypothetical protein